MSLTPAAEAALNVVKKRLDQTIHALTVVIEAERMIKATRASHHRSCPRWAGSSAACTCGGPKPKFDGGQING